jgi:pyridoxal phosphate enzyme (YggS family)
MSSIAKAIENIKLKISKFGRDPENTTLVAVSKLQPVDLILEAINCGQLEFGENYFKELYIKATGNELKDKKLKWHYLGPLQTNKISKLSNFVNTLQSISRIKELHMLAKYKVESNLLIQINLSNNQNQSGISLKTLDEFLNIGAKLNLNIKGIMVMGVAGDRKLSEQLFNTAYKVFEDYNFDTLSMGMSDDYEVALACGSNMIRIGTHLFGKRDIKLPS